MSFNFGSQDTVAGAEWPVQPHRNTKGGRQKYHVVLDKKPNAFFSVNLVSRKPEKCSPETNQYLRKFLKHIPWMPREIALFAGKLDYGMYSFTDRLMIQLIMLITKGPTDLTTKIEFTDWSKVDVFGMKVSKM